MLLRSRLALSPTLSQLWEREPEYLGIYFHVSRNMTSFTEYQSSELRWIYGLNVVIV
jgi:hypothetical protein